MTRVSGPAGHLHVNDGGSGGVPVVFVHAFAGNATQWTAQLEHSRRSRRAVAFDLRGHGQSEAAPDTNYAVEALAGDIGAVADTLGLDRFVLVGHSLGGAAAIAYAGSHPERVAGLVMVGAPGKAREDQSNTVIAAMEADYEKTSLVYWARLLTHARPEVEKQIRREINSVPRAAALRLIRAVFAFDPLPSLERYRGPKLSITTAEADMPNDLHRLVPNLPHKTVSGTSHWMHMDKADEFNRILDAFLAEIS